MPDTAFDRAVQPVQAFFTLHRGPNCYFVQCLRCSRSFACLEFPHASGFYEPLRMHLLDHGVEVYKLLSFAVTDCVR